MIRIRFEILEISLLNRSHTGIFPLIFRIIMIWQILSEKWRTLMKLWSCSQSTFSHTCTRSIIFWFVFDLQILFAIHWKLKPVLQFLVERTLSQSFSKQVPWNFSSFGFIVCKNLTMIFSKLAESCKIL